MKYYEIVLYSTSMVQRIRYLPENEVEEFKQWLTNDKGSNTYCLTFEKSLTKSRTECSIIFKNNLLNVDFDLYEE